MQNHVETLDVFILNESFGSFLSKLVKKTKKVENETSELVKREDDFNPNEYSNDVKSLNKEVEELKKQLEQQKKEEEQEKHKEEKRDKYKKRKEKSQKYLDSAGTVLSILSSIRKIYVILDKLIINRDPDFYNNKLSGTFKTLHSLYGLTFEIENILDNI